MEVKDDGDILSTFAEFHQPRPRRRLLSAYNPIYFRNRLRALIIGCR